MTLNKIRKNTLIILLLCIVVIGSIGVNDVLQAKWWQAPVWLVKMWNAILKLENTQKGRLALIAAMENEQALAEDEIAKTNDRLNYLLGKRNLWTKLNLPNEQEKTRARLAMNAAAEKHNIALSAAETFREEIAELEAELKLTYYSEERYGIIETAIAEKKALLAQAEFVMETENAKYEAEQKAYKKVIYSLSYTTKRDTISRLTYQISLCESKIESLRAKIKKLGDDITDETDRRVEVDVEIDEKYKEYYKLEEDAKKPGPQI